MPAPREQLANMLRQARIAAGYSSHAKLAEKMTVSRSVISKAESRVLDIPSDDTLALYAKHTGASLAVLTDLAVKARSAPQGWFVTWTDIESRATLIRWFEQALVPGLLQTESYARAVLSWKPDSADTEANLADRLARQMVLSRAELRVLLLASVLNREVGDADVMAEQCEYLVSVGSRPSVMLQIVPDLPCVAGALGGSLAVATEGAADVAAYAESNIKGSIYTDPDLIARAVRVFDGLRMDALPWSQTREVLVKASEKWKT
jgi:transcriptional regulator with XRE-family HTH domain